MEQRDYEWFLARTAKLTASNAHKIMSNPKTKADKEAGKWSQVARTYMDEVVSEMDTGIPVNKGAGEAQKWGIAQEEAARVMAFEMLKEQFGREDFREATGEFAFIQHPKFPWAGCSPDFLVGDDAFGELKCPFNGGRHITAAIETAPWFLREHKWQIMHGLWCSGRTQYYAASYYPKSKSRPMAMDIIPANKKDIAELETRAIKFREACLDRLATFRGHSF